MLAVVCYYLTHRVVHFSHHEPLLAWVQEETPASNHLMNSIVVGGEVVNKGVVAVWTADVGGALPSEGQVSGFFAKFGFFQLPIYNSLHPL